MKENLKLIDQEIMKVLQINLHNICLESQNWIFIYSSENYFLLSKLNLIPLIAYINEIARVTILLWVLEVHGIESVTNT